MTTWRLVAPVMLAVCAAAPAAKAQSVNHWLDEGCKVISVSAMGSGSLAVALDCTELTRTLRKTGKSKVGEVWEKEQIDKFGYIVVCFTGAASLTPSTPIQSEICQSLD